MPAVMERDLLLPWVLLHVYGHYQSWGKRSHVSLQYSPQELLPSGSFLHLYKWICMLTRLLKVKTRRQKGIPRKHFSNKLPLGQLS